MSLESKVIWSEGMFLNPQHFQQQERYLERYADARSRAAGAYLWGFFDYELDQQLLKLGKISFLSGRGIFPDGTPFNFPEIDEPPPVIDLPENLHNRLLYIGVPVRRLGAVDVLPQEGAQGLARYYPKEQDVRDSSLESGDNHNLQVGKLRLRVLLDTDDLSGYACIGVAKILETRQDKDILLDDKYIATVMDCRAAPRLQGFMVELAGMLRHRAEAIAGRLADTRRGGTAEVSDYMLLQMLNRLEPTLVHLSRLQGVHPVALFKECVGAVGELATFNTKTHRPPELPAYLHDNLQASFEAVFAHLRQLLATIYEQTAIAIGLEDKGYGIRVADKYDKSLVTSAVFILVVRADVAEEIIRTRLPLQMKIGPVENIRQLINSALNGILIKPLPVAPRQIPFRAGHVYFELEQRGEIWRYMTTSGGFAMHVGGEFPGLEMEFWAIRR
jgi:type VI secretion system protein ImpJ